MFEILDLELFTDVIDNSGIQFFYTSTPRQHDAGILTVGHFVNRLMIVPPNAGSYFIAAQCSAECTNEVQKTKTFCSQIAHNAFVST